jgi:hypothetical protein
MKSWYDYDPDAYKNYLKSKEWALKKEQLFLKRGKVCERCKSTQDIHVHHKHYKTLFNERLIDLEVLCQRCHFNHHNQLKNNKKQKNKKHTDLQKPKKKIIELFEKGFPLYKIIKLLQISANEAVKYKRAWEYHKNKHTIKNP